MSITIKDIAHEANVGLATVSRVINKSGYVKPETRDRVEAAIKKLHYTPSTIARSLVTNQTNIIGVIIPDISNPFFGDVIKGITKVLESTSFDLIFYNTNENSQHETKALKTILKNRVQGLIMTPVVEINSDISKTLHSVQNSGIPVILIDRDINGFDCDGIFIDNVRGAYEATRLLLNEGHRKIAIIHGPVTSMPGRDRLKGYLDAYRSMNLTPNPEHQLESDFMIEGAIYATKQILKMQHNRPTAIFCGNNLITMGCIKTLYENGMRIPEDMAVVGFDEIDPNGIWGQNITVVSRQTTEMGSLAMHTLLGKIRHSGNNVNTGIQRIVLQPHLLVRGSEKFFRK